LVLALPWAAGCNLDDYVKKFAGETERIKRFDEADLALGNRTTFPKNVGTPKQPIFQAQEYLFIRLPYDFNTDPDNKPTDPVGGILHRYTRKPTGGQAAPGTVTMVPMQPGALFPPPNEKEQGIREIYLAFAMDGKVDDFRKRLLSVFPGAKPETQRRKIDRVGREPILFDVWTWKDNYQPQSEYWIFGCQGDSGTMAAVVFRIPEGKSNANNIKTPIQFTLQSLILGSTAPAVGENFKPRKEGPKKPTS
jgi:hypothetical protein